MFFKEDSSNNKQSLMNVQKTSIEFSKDEINNNIQFENENEIQSSFKTLYY